MRKNIDYRLPENRFEGFNAFYNFMLDTNDWSPDINVETWIADDGQFDFEKRCVMALMHGATYAGPCEMMISDRFPVITPNIIPECIRFFEENKKRLLFSPDCKYRKMVFPKFLQSIGDSIQPFGSLGKYIQHSLNPNRSHTENYLELQKRCMKDWFHWGRMGHWCFAEALFHFVKAPIQPPNMEFADGKSHRDGWAFCIGRDDLIDKKTVTKAELALLEQSAADYLTKLNRPEANFLNLETACCNYKRQHKGSRYGGCYIDEQAWETDYMKTLWPEYNWLWNKYFEGRQAVIPHQMLAELHPENRTSESAYLKTWNKVLFNYGRIPRAEAWHNKEPQIWHELEEAKKNWIVFDKPAPTKRTKQTNKKNATSKKKTG